MRKTPRLARRVPWIALVLIVGCAPGASTPTAEAPSQPSTGQQTQPGPAGTPSEVILGSQLSFAEDTTTSAEGLVTFDKGGMVTSTARDGTRFELVVPAKSVLLDTTIRLTPLLDVEGLGDGPVHAVRMEPEGLFFFEAAKLAITPAVPIPVAEQLMFQADDSGAEVTAALVDVQSEPIVLLVEHFSVFGASKAQRASLLIGQAASALTQLQHEVGAYLQAERRRQLAGAAQDPGWSEVLDRLFAAAKSDVLGPLREATLLTCDATQDYVQGLWSVERQRQLIGEATEETNNAMLTEVERAHQASFGICEREAIAKCKAAQPPNPTILLDFWFEWDRQRALRGYEEPMALVGDVHARANRICMGTRWVFERVFEAEERGIKYVITYDGILEVSTEGSRDPESGEVSVDGPIAGTGTGTIVGRGGECTQEDRTVPVDVSASGSFSFEFDGNRSGEKLYIALIALDPQVEVSGSWAPCADWSELVEYTLEMTLTDPIYYGTAVVVEEVGTTTESAEEATARTTLLEPPPTPAPRASGTPN